MSGGNYQERVLGAIDSADGPLPGGELLECFKDECISDPVLNRLLGENGERIFTEETPNINETITPGLILTWGDDRFQSLNTYLEGTIDAALILPVNLEGDYKNLRKIALLFMRFIGGPMCLFDKVPGLIMFGADTTFDYRGMIVGNGVSLPVIKIRIPYRFDLHLLSLAVAFDPHAPIDDSELGQISAYFQGLFDSETNETLIPEGVLLENE